MALFKFFKVKDNLNNGTGSSIISRKEVEAANKEVANALQSMSEKKTSHGKYNSYTPQQRAKIGKYAAKNGPIKAAKHFTTTWGIHVNELTVRRLKLEYLEKLKEVVSKAKSAAEEEESKSEYIKVNSLETK